MEMGNMESPTPTVAAEMGPMGKRKGMGKRKIEIKKIQKKSSLGVTFSKRRTGLFKKAGDLSVLCGAEVAAIVFSPADKAYVFGQPSADAVIDRFINNDSGEPNANDRKETASGERERERGVWWEAPIENMGLTELLRHQEALLELIKKGKDRVEEMGTDTTLSSSIQTMESSPSVAPAPAPAQGYEVPPGYDLGFCPDKESEFDLGFCPDDWAFDMGFSPDEFRFNFDDEFQPPL